MGDKKKELSAEEQLAALQSEVAAQKEIIAGQNEELENLDAEKKHKAVIITHKKAKYKANTAACVLKVDGELRKIEIYNKETGKKVADAADVDAILAKKGQNILKEV
ncbi:MAG: hypothetical protein ACPG5W_00550 [Flavobacteriales bacterium]